MANLLLMSLVLIIVNSFYCGFKILLPYLLEYKSHFFVPENQSRNGGATYTRG